MIPLGTLQQLITIRIRTFTVFEHCLIFPDCELFVECKVRSTNSPRTSE